MGREILIELLIIGLFFAMFVIWMFYRNWADTKAKKDEAEIYRSGKRYSARDAEEYSDSDDSENTDVKDFRDIRCPNCGKINRVYNWKKNSGKSLNCKNCDEPI